MAGFYEVDEAGGLRVGDRVTFPLGDRRAHGTIDYIMYDEGDDDHSVGIIPDPSERCLAAAVSLGEVRKEYHGEIETAGLPVILKCPRGEEWPAESFHTLVSYKENIQTHDTITVMCPLGHSFSLKRAVKSKMFTPEQALQMISLAQKELPELRKEARQLNRAWRKKPRRVETD